MRRALFIAALIGLAVGGPLLLRTQSPARAAHRTAAHRTPTAVPAARAHAAQQPSAALAALGRRLRNRWHVSAHSGAYVLDLDTGQTVFASRSDRRRVPASVEKLYTTSTALLRYGTSGRLTTRVAGDGTLDADGTWHGDLYLIGGGDPTFGSRAFARRWYGTAPATVERLATRLRKAGIRRVDGSVRADESYFDSLRGGPSSDDKASFYVGPLSAVDYDRGLTPHGRFQPDPPDYAAGKLAHALRDRHVHVTGRSRPGTAPQDATLLASVVSPPMATLVRLTNRDSDNFFAEMLVKGIGARFGETGSTAAGAAAVRSTVGDLAGISPRIVDGSGLSRSDRTSPREVVALLTRMWPGATAEAGGAQAEVSQAAAQALLRSLPTASRTGTLQHRMGGTAAAGRCHAKTGTLDGVSALAGYCSSHAGDTFAFAFLMNGMTDWAAHAVQDREAAQLAAYAG